ncbi:hypothetical protein QBC43DRAFT_222264 [Cladorrhinum sp. PSN259]|nr:hypothetical protein QBC43DRAFT_222264 [Cladorrhinum sp. PSN259]
MAGEGVQSPPTPELSPELLRLDHGPKLIRILTAMTIIVTITVLLRVVTRIKRRVPLGLDDWLILSALLPTWGMYIVAVLLVKLGGLGKPLAVNMAIDPNRIMVYHKVLFAGELIYATALALTKLSVLAMYRRCFPTKIMKVGWFGLGGITVAWWLAVCISTIFQCTPVRKVFDPARVQGHCIDIIQSFLGNSIPNILTDVVIFFLPTYEVLKLHIPRHQRVALAAVFLLGAGVIFGSSYRLHVTIVLARKGPTADLTVVMCEPMLWAVLEPQLAVICASLPTLRPLLTTALNSKVLAPVRSWFPRRDNTYGLSPFAGNATISGTPMRIGRGSSVAAKTGGASIEIIPSSVSSQQRFNLGDPEAGFVSSGYGTESRVTVGKSGSESGHSNEFPLESIAVKTVIDWRETKHPRDLQG